MGDSEPQTSSPKSAHIQRQMFATRRPDDSCDRVGALLV
jgi:hypothetical protein